ncbi:MAG TPA: LytTR family DNA-binding domain-containing protein [Candidatus Aquicultor sp.]|jgi:two-component system LytT family response regulator
MLRVIIADDDPYMRIILRKALARISDIEVAAEVENGEQLIQAATTSAPDVIFVDIDMPETDGLEAVRRISTNKPDTFIIFATGYDSYTHEAFEVYAFDYLVKPFNAGRIEQTIERIKKVKDERREVVLADKQAINPEKADAMVCVKSNNKQYFIKNQDIILVTRVGRKTILYTRQGTIETKQTLQDIDRALCSPRFFRCHKGYIINADMVTEVLPYGNKTYIVKFAGTDKTALMPLDKVREFRARYDNAVM